MESMANGRPHVLDDPEVFPEERACALDHAPFKSVFCTRRAAKSFSTGLEFIDDSYDWPGANYLFLGLVREEAKGIFWKDVLKALNRKHNLGMRFNESALVATMPNGAEIHIGAADSNEEEMRKKLGRRYRKVCIDEAQAWIHADLHALVYDTLKPACSDHRGSISLRGTPGKYLTNFFRKLTPISVQAGMRGEKGEHPGWSLHCWDTHANTAVIELTGRRMCDQWAEDIAALKASNPGIEETPAFRRNYLGEWVLDETNLVFTYKAGRNDFDGRLPTLPQHDYGQWHYVLAIDLGYHPDPTAFLLYAYHDGDQTLYGLESWKEWRLDITAVAERVKKYQVRYRLDTTVIDGSNKQAVMEMSTRHGLALTPADKTGKADFIEIMNAEMTLGRIKFNMDACNQGAADKAVAGEEGGLVKQTLSLADEFAGLVWDSKKLKETGKREEHASCPNHLTDAALYGWRYCYQYMSKPKEAVPAPGTKEAYEREQRFFFERERQRILEEKAEQQEPFGPASFGDWGIG